MNKSRNLYNFILFFFPQKNKEKKFMNFLFNK